jgi:hypothetical protein
MEMQRYLDKTPLLDFSHPRIKSLVNDRPWQTAAPEDRTAQIYTHVRDAVPFGYNRADDLPASAVLADGYGQCNTKTTLLMALLRAVGIPCRLRGFTIDKALQKGVFTGLIYVLAPRRILHTWVDVRHARRWVALEGVILDRPYLESIQSRFADCRGGFCGYAIATDNLQAPPVFWQGGDTFIQKEGIREALGAFDTPDDFYAHFGTNLKGLRRILFQRWVVPRLNRTVRRLRDGHRFQGPDVSSTASKGAGRCSVET